MKLWIGHSLCYVQLNCNEALYSIFPNGYSNKRIRIQDFFRYHEAHMDGFNKCICPSWSFQLMFKQQLSRTHIHIQTRSGDSLALRVWFSDCIVSRILWIQGEGDKDTYSPLQQFNRMYPLRRWEIHKDVHSFAWCKFDFTSLSHFLLLCFLLFPHAWGNMGVRSKAHMLSNK